MPIYNHLKQNPFESVFREVVFGVEDGMVSTLGAITGIAIGSQDHYTVLLAGMVIIAVESISMGIGSYLSNKSEDDLENQKIQEEKHEIHHFPQEEGEELYRMLRRDGWDKKMAEKMVVCAIGDKKLLLKEMQYRELGISVKVDGSPRRKGFFMLLSYIFGGAIPLMAYFFLPVVHAMPISMIVTLVGLFGLGVFTTKFTKQGWLKAGTRVLILGGIALTVGLLVGELSRAYIEY